MHVLTFISSLSIIFFLFLCVVCGVWWLHVACVSCVRLVILQKKYGSSSGIVYRYAIPGIFGISYLVSANIALCTS